MFFRLRTRILATFSAIVFLSMILMVLIINFSTRSGYETFIKKNDLDTARRLAPLLGHYYKERGDFDLLKEDLYQISRKIEPGMRMMHRGNFMHGDFPPLLILDREGNTLFANERGPLGDKDYHLEKREIRSSSIAIVADRKIVGYLLVGTMINPSLNEGEIGYLNKITVIVVSVSLFILFVSLIVSHFFSKRITRPVTELRLGAEEVAAGNYSSRVEVSGSDELSNLGDSFNKMAQSLEDNDLWRKQIIADSAHELRTPVSLIQGNLEMILEGVYEADEKHIQALYDETLVLSRLIKELQVLSSAESGSMVLNLQELDLGELVYRVLNIFQAGEKKEGIHIINSLPSDLPSVKGDYQKLKQVLVNILANAFHHTPSGGQIEIRGKVLGRDLIIEIEDSGSGIDHEDLDRIFERFFRTDSSRNRNHGGSGLGLAISREIVRLHGGKIRAESPPQKGAIIVVNLPYLK